MRVKNEQPPHIAELQREIAIWERTAQRLNVVSLEERAVRDAILAKAMDVRNQLNQEVNVTMHSSKDLWQKNLSILESKYRITDWVLLVKSVIVLAVVIGMFFLSNLIPKVELNLGTIAIRRCFSAMLTVGPLPTFRVDCHLWCGGAANPCGCPRPGIHTAQD